VATSSSETKPTVARRAPRRWYGSLYWRIAAGFVLFLGALLAAQGALFFWLLGRAVDKVPGGSPGEFSRQVAERVATALRQNPDSDLWPILREPERQGPSFVIVMKDGRVLTSGRGLPPPSLVRMARRRLDAETLEQLRETDRRPEFRRLPGFAPIVVHGNAVGLVVSAPFRSYREVAGDLGPLMLVLGLSLLALGTTLAAVLIFGPARRRLAQFEDAIRTIAAGDLTARAPEEGGDEIAAVAHAFNEMAAELARRADIEERSTRMRRQLLADVSHELRTPLTAMRGYSETLTMPGLTLDEETRARYFGIFLQEAQRLERIAGDLLDLARLEEGGIELDCQDVAIERLFGRVTARHEQTAREAGVTLITSIAPGAEIVYGDPMRLEQVLQNLAANALRHTPGGGRVELGAEPTANGAIVLTVRDTGEGIAPEHLASIFDRFYKVDSARGAGASGSGLGLSIAKAIVERHGGRITVASVPGQGTAFRIELPAGS
jgi:signal transduction histidine kinase